MVLPNHFNHLIILDLHYTPLSKNIGSVLKRQISDMYQNIEQESPFLEIEKVESSMKQRNKNIYLKFKHKIRNKILDNEYFKCIYLLTTPNNTVVIHEVAEEPLDNEEYI